MCKSIFNSQYNYYPTMDSISHSNNHVKMSTIFFHFTCVIPMHSNQTNVDMLSPNLMKSIKKTMSKAIKQKWLKMKKKEDERCLWKKTILMGEKCKPMQFPGAIFYDDKGNRLFEPPRSKTNRP